MDRYPSEKEWVGLYLETQHSLVNTCNPHITNIEGFIILESSLKAEPQQILELYKQKDVAEKFIREMKEGGELMQISFAFDPSSFG